MIKTSKETQFQLIIKQQKQKEIFHQTPLNLKTVLLFLKRIFNKNIIMVRNKKKNIIMNKKIKDNSKINNTIMIQMTNNMQKIKNTKANKEY